MGSQPGEREIVLATPEELPETPNSVAQGQRCRRFFFGKNANHIAQLCYAASTLRLGSSPHQQSATKKTAGDVNVCAGQAQCGGHAQSMW